MSVAVPDGIPQIILPPECQIAFDIKEVYAALRYQHWPVAAEGIAKVYSSLSFQIFLLESG